MDLRHLLLAGTGALALLVAPMSAHAQSSRFDALVDAPFKGDFPTPASIDLLTDELYFTGDFGFAGPDGGKGGKYLIVPWDYKGPDPEGYYVYRTRTDNVFVF
jgi:uncharacterized protein DUF1254